MTWLERLELPLLRRITCEWETPIVDTLAAFLNDALFGLPFFLLLFLLGATRAAGRARFVRAALTTLIALGVGHAVLRGFWVLLPRDRPGDHFAEAQTLRGPIGRASCGEHPEMWVERAHPPKSPSFPSSHATTAGAAAAGLWALSRALGAIGWLYAFGVGLARLYWGKHWPSDVLGAFVIASLAAWLGWRVAPAIEARVRRLRGRPT